MRVSQVPRGVWATAGVLAVAAATVGVPSERAVAVGAGLEVASGSGAYTLKAEPYIPSDSNTSDSVTLTNTGTTKITSYTLTVDYSSLDGVVDVTAPFSGCEKKTAGVLVCQGKDAPSPGKTTRLENFRVRSLKGARGGTTSEIRVSGQADGAAITERVWKVDILDKGSRRRADLDGQQAPRRSLGRDDGHDSPGHDRGESPGAVLGAGATVAVSRGFRIKKTVKKPRTTSPSPRNLSPRQGVELPSGDDHFTGVSFCPVWGMS
ncbi:hypothetical protein ACFYW8_32125 [Streptomyces sp. NPDC002742]|uniref:hypothetical protein n=1 Tax=Streptomyces sp. NPDC002742 TaxID=3364663 RepID=UPI0036776429